MAGRYSVIESCIRPSGAYAKTQESFRADQKAEAEAYFQRAWFNGPGFGIITSKTIELVYSELSHSQREWKVLASRSIP